jgi:hypothetical protein
MEPPPSLPEIVGEAAIPRSTVRRHSRDHRPGDDIEITGETETTTRDHR